jgi:hypothetical protein
MGNYEKIEGTAYSNGAIDVPIGEADGWIGKLILNGPSAPLKLRFEVIRRAIDGMSAGDEYVSFEQPLWADAAVRQYANVRFAGSPLVVSVYGPAPERDEWETEFDAGMTLGIFDLGLEYDRDSYAWDYPETVASIAGTSWEGSASRLAGRAKADILGDRLWLGVEGEVLSRDADPGLWSRVFDTRELIFRGGAGLIKDWGLLLDVRHVTYEDVPGASGTSDESFWNPYLALAFTPRKNVELRVGYGVNPTSYTDTAVEGRGNGRERWRAEYQWDHSGADVVAAEKALEDARTIGVMAVIAF